MLKGISPLVSPELLAALATMGHGEEILFESDTETSGEAKIEWLDRFAFYERSREAFAIVVTGETRKYGNVIVKKGVIDSR